MAEGRGAAARSWGEPVALDDGVPQDPYAHWRWQRCGAPAGFVALTGASLGALEVRFVRETAALGDQSGVPRDGRLMPLIGLPGDALNEAGQENIGEAIDREPAAGYRAIVGIVDDGIGFANERFRDGDGTRIDWLWLQGIPDRDRGRPPAQPFGSELAGSDIDALLEDHRLDETGQVVDEEAVYRAVGMLDPARPEVQSVAAAISHGTGVLDHAAGFDWDAAADGDGPGRSVAIVAVCLPSEVVQDTAGTVLDLYVILAIRRILARARAINAARGGAALPVMINLSFSLTAGPKDGTSLLERCIAAEIDAYPDLRVFVAAGNHRLDRTHARFRQVAAGAAAEVTWRVLPDDRTASFVEVWTGPEPTPADGRPVALLSVRPPGSAGYLSPEAVAPPLDGYVTLGPEDAPAARAYYSWHPDPDNSACGRQRIVLVTPPTAPDQPGQHTVPAGDWGLRLDKVAGEAVAVDLHVQRDDTLAAGARRGRQSYFVDPGYRDYGDDGRVLEVDVDPAVPVTRMGTLNAFGTHPRIAAVSGFRRRGPAEMPYAGLGSVAAQATGRCARAQKPRADAIAASDDSLVHRGLPVTGTLSGSRALISGTSVACPRALRHALDRVIDGGAGQTPDGRDWPPVRIAEKPVTEPAPAPRRGGAGRPARLDGAGPPS